MSKKKRSDSTPDDVEQMPAGRSDRGVGGQGSGSGYVDGIGGTAGAGSVRAKPERVGDISGIPAETTEEMPMPGSVGKGKSGARHGQMNDGGLSGKLKGTNTDSVPNQEPKGQSDDV
jgi:hypothetical protein